MSELLSLSIVMKSLTFALNVAASGAAVGASLLLAMWLMQRRSENTRYGALLAGTSLLLAIPALVGIGQQLPPEFFGVVAAEEVIRLPAERLPELLGGQSGIDETKESLEHAGGNISWGVVLGCMLLGIWLIGIAVGLVHFAAALWKQSRILIGQPWRTDYWTEALQARLARKLGLATFPGVYRSPVAPMPMVLGTWRPIILLPESAPKSWGQPQWEAILLHEAAHIARRDPWAVLIQRFAVILFWWCPFVHALTRRLNALRENICDDYALAGNCDPIAYAQILVETAERFVSLKAMPVPLALLDSAQRGLEIRVTRLLAKEKRPMTKLSIFGKLLGAGVLGAACLATTAATALSQSQPEKKVQIKILLDGKEIDLSDPRFLQQQIEAPQSKANPAIDVVIRKDKTETPTRSYRLVTDVDVSKKADDPRVEELIKQAEAIKPGSGAAIRKALQGTTGQADLTKKTTFAITGDGKQTAIVGDDKTVRLWNSTTGKPVPALVDTIDGKKIIILSIDADKVIQLQKSDVKKHVEAGVHSITTRREGDITKTPTSTATKKSADSVPMEVYMGNIRKAETKTANPAADVESLRKQLERLASQIHELERRLERQGR